MIGQGGPTDLENRFTYHPPATEGRREAHERIRIASHTLADVVERSVPDGRERALALTKIEEAMFWANAGIARQQQ